MYMDKQKCFEEYSRKCLDAMNIISTSVHGISTALVIIILQYNFMLPHFRQK